MSPLESEPHETESPRLQVVFGPKLSPFPAAIPDSIELYFVLKYLKISFVELDIQKDDIEYPMFPYVISEDNKKTKIRGLDRIYHYISHNILKHTSSVMTVSANAVLLASYINDSLKPALCYYMWKNETNYNQNVYPNLVFNCAYNIFSARYLRQYMLNELHGYDNDSLPDKEIYRHVEKLLDDINSLIRLNKFFSKEKDRLTILDFRLFSYVILLKYTVLKDCPLDVYFNGSSPLALHFNFIEKVVDSKVFTDMSTNFQSPKYMNEKSQKMIMAAFAAVSLLLIYISRK